MLDPTSYEGTYYLRDCDTDEIVLVLTDVEVDSDGNPCKGWVVNGQWQWKTDGVYDYAYRDRAMLDLVHQCPSHRMRSERIVSATAPDLTDDIPF